jgi:hypothetical protein
MAKDGTKPSVRSNRSGTGDTDGIAGGSTIRIGGASATNGSSGESETVNSGNGVTVGGVDSTQGNETDGRKRPRYTKAPGLKEDAKPAAARATTRSKTSSPSITKETCGYVIGGLSAGVSVALCGNLSLATDEDETSELGEHLYNALQTIPDSPVTKIAVKVAPWSGLIAKIVEIIFDRIMQIKAYAAMQAQEADRIRRLNARNTPVGDVKAPQPVQVGHDAPNVPPRSTVAEPGTVAPAPEIDWRD